MDKIAISEELNYLLNKINELEELIRSSNKKTKVEKQENTDRELQLSAMNLYRLYLQKRLERLS